MSETPTTKSKEEWTRLLTDLAYKGRLAAFERSFFNASNAERRRRLAWVTQLSIALAEVEKQTLFATALARGDIENVIEGDWKDLAESVQHWRFEEDGEQVRQRYALIYSKFRELLEHCVAESTGQAGSA